LISIYGQWKKGSLSPRSSYTAAWNQYAAAIRTGALALAPSCTDRDISHASTCSPVPLTTLAKMPWLLNVVVVIVTELCIHAIATRAWQDFVWLLQNLLSTRYITLRLGYLQIGL
jgi:hypothetical protein